jgi:hypothetical protein
MSQRNNFVRLTAVFVDRRSNLYQPGASPLDRDKEFRVLTLQSPNGALQQIGPPHWGL